ncbi:Uncharacterised protein [Bordetella pertussis]|nr:Uncharacterised protein [Bordetella pertussis]CPN71800.1 Uncharacterised protein [Bordetella pertussis]CPO25288.1 Uncharacterised protein [Bordetella pertussis]
MKRLPASKVAPTPLARYLPRTETASVAVTVKSFSKRLARRVESK